VSCTRLCLFVLHHQEYVKSRSCRSQSSAGVNRRPLSSLTPHPASSSSGAPQAPLESLESSTTCATAHVPDASRGFEAPCRNDDCVTLSHCRVGCIGAHRHEVLGKPFARPETRLGFRLCFTPTNHITIDRDAEVSCRSCDRRVVFSRYSSCRCAAAIAGAGLVAHGDEFNDVPGRVSLSSFPDVAAETATAPSS
jgi:hypothetical protein